MYSEMPQATRGSAKEAIQQLRGAELLEEDIRMTRKRIPSQVGNRSHPRGAALALTMGFFWILAGTANAHHPHDIIDDFALSPNLQNDGTVFVGSNGSVNVFLRSSNNGASWVEKRRGLSGRVLEDIGFTRGWKRSGIAYVVTSAGALQATTNHGDTWVKPLQVGKLDKLEVTDAPGLSFSLFFANKTQLFRSEDGGFTADSVYSALPSEKLVCLTASPGYEADSTAALGIDSGRIAVTQDGGQTWIHGEVPSPPTAIAISPDFGLDQTLWVTTWGSGIQRSTDGGLTFGEINVGIEDLYTNDVDVAPTYPAPQDLWLVASDAGVFKSTDGGDTWVKNPFELVKTNQTDDHYRQIKLSPQYPDHPVAYVGTFEGLYATFDGGTIWRQANINPTRMGRLVSISPTFAQDATVVGAGYGMHMLMSEDQGASFDVRFTEFQALSAYSVSLSPNYAEDNLMIVGIGFGIRRSTDGGRTYLPVQLNPHDSLSVGYNALRTIAFSPNFKNDQTVFGAANGGFYTSTDAGITWDVKLPPFKAAWKLAISPEFPSDSTLFLGGPEGDTGIYRTENAGRSWFSAGDLATPIKDVYVSPDYGTTQRLFIITEHGGVELSSDRGANWVSKNVGLEGTAPVRIKLSKDFATNGTAVVATESHGIFESTDSGDSWHSISPAPSPVDHGQSLAIAPDYPITPYIWAGGWNGLQRSTDRGATWELVSKKEIYDEGRPEPWILTGTWRREIGTSGSINNGWAYSEEPGATMILPFQGTGARWIGTRGPDHGYARVLLDGKQAVTVDTYAPTELVQETLADFQNLDNDFHYLAIRVQDRRNEASTGNRVVMDAIEVSYE